MLLVVLCAVIMVGCGGSSASTSHAEVVAVAAAEHDLTTAWRRANVQAQERCEGKAPQAAVDRCFAVAVVPRERAAEVRFSAAVDKVLEAGVGGECEKALEEALGEVSSIPLFQGEATRACGKESRGE
jgi:hypothetical protein